MPYGFNDDKSKFDLTGKVLNREDFIVADQEPVQFNDNVSKAAVGTSTVSFYIRLTHDVIVDDTNAKEIGTIVEGLRPKVYAEASVRKNSVSYEEVGTCYIGTDGVMTLYIPEGTYTNDLFIAGTYVC